MKRPRPIRLRGRPTRAALLCAVLLSACAPDAPEPAEAPAREEPVVQDVVESAAWSRDGARLAVAWTRGDRTRVYGLFGPQDSVPPEPSTGIPLTPQGRAPTWSPDGLWLAYEAGPEEGGEIHRVRPDGTGAEGLVEHAADDGDPAYTPDGRALAFVSDREGEEPRIWIADADGSDPRLLETGVAGPHDAPAWAPDGRHLAFTVGEGARSTVWVASPDGTDARALGRGSAPSWGPRGASVFFTRRDSIFSRPPDAEADERFVTEGRSPAVSPNGRWLALVRGNREEAALYLVDLDGLEATRITP